MRILSVTAQKADSTGSGVFLTELVKSLDKAGHEQAVICGVTREDMFSFPEHVRVFPVFYQSGALPFPVCGMSDEMPYESTRYCDLTDEMTRQLYDAFRAKVTEAVEAFRPDVVLCHHLYFLTALVRELYPSLPVYGQCHGSDLRQIRKNPWQREQIRNQITMLDGIFALHERQKEMICDIFGVPEKLVTVMGTGYNSDIFFPRADLRQSGKTEKFRMIFAGKLSEKKGVISLLRALNGLERPEEYELALAGGAGNEEEFREIWDLAQSAPCEVSFLGRLDHRELAREMNASDALVLPSFYEGLPLVLLEAMACSLRVLCTDLPGVREWLDQTVSGHGVLFVEPPETRNEDEPLRESLPAFERRLAEAVTALRHQPLADLTAVQSVSWNGLCAKMTGFWKAQHIESK